MPMLRSIACAVCVTAAAVLTAACGDAEPSQVPCPAGADAWDQTRWTGGETVVGRQASPYAGPGPHALLVVYEAERAETQRIVRTSGKDSDLQLPDGWPAASTGAQLVLCRYFIRRESGPAVDSCEFLGPEGTVTASAVPTTWAFRLWEARTARFVTGFDLPGEYAHCPQLNSIEKDGRASDLLSVPSDQTLIDRLRPWVEKPLP